MVCSSNTLFLFPLLFIVWCFFDNPRQSFSPFPVFQTFLYTCLRAFRGIKETENE